MKRELLQNVRVAPYESGAAIDRKNYLSLIFAAVIDAAGALNIKFTHCDTESGTYEDVPDKQIAPNEGSVTGGVINYTVSAGDTLNIDVDLLGCRQFIKITASGAAATGATYAYAIGDPQYAPV